MLIAVMLVMAVCLAFEGLFVAFSGFPFSGLQLDVYLVGFIWLGTCVSTFYYLKRPLVALMFGWAMLLVTSISMGKDRAISHSALGYLWEHSVELLFILASHIGYFLVLRHRTRPMS